MWKEFYKNEKCFTFEMNRFYSGIENREEKLIKDGYIPIFDRRRLSYLNGKGGSIILENDIEATSKIISFQEELKHLDFSKNNSHILISSIHKNHIPSIKKQIEEKRVKNIIIDSAFKDIKQFRFLIINLFSFFTDLNFFIISRDSLLKLLKNEVKDNMQQYPIRNPYYKYGKDNIPYFNDLFFTLYKNDVYEMEDDIFKQINITVAYEGIEVFYNKSFKWMRGNYTTDDSDITPIDQKSKWE